MQNAKVCISTPTKGYLRAETAEWRERAFAELAPRVELHTVIDPAPLMHARNRQVLRFFKTDCTHLFLLDSDCIPQPGTIQRLLLHNKPIVSAPHPGRKGDSVILMVVDPAPNPGDGYVVHLPIQGVQGPDVRVGAAGLLIMREVLLKLEPPWFRDLYDDQGLLARSEDFDFCERVLEMGYEIWADCDIPQRHFCGEWL